MSEHFKLNAAVMAIMIRGEGEEKEILLQKRQNTGFRDGYWDFATSGHLEAKESLTEALVREMKEEIDVDVNPEDCEFCHLVHLTEEKINIDYINCYFMVKKYKGEPRIMEPEKCSDLKWFLLSNLPNDLIPSRARVLKNVLNHSLYSEDGFK